MFKKTIVASIAILIVAIGYFSLRESNDKLTNLWGDYYNSKKEKKLKKESSNKQARILELQKYFKGIKTHFGEEEPAYPVNYLMSELLKVKLESQFKLAEDTIDWVMRGPGNVGGRTRAILVDPDDATHNTWIAGSATGGAWKTTDGGGTWEHVSKNIPYLATTSLAMAKSASNVIYMGTGESFPGSMMTTGGGLFKSSDKGDSWTQLESTSGNENFRWINRIVVDPGNENIILVATTTGIFRSINGGNNWDTVYKSTNSVEDIVADTSDFHYLYAGENSVGILRSVDSGKTWVNTTPLLATGKGRFELAVSPVNPQRIIASVDKIDSEASYLFVSNNRGVDWMVFQDSVNNNIHYLGGQGSYDNTIAAHPYNEDIVFVGGVNLWSFSIGDSIYTDGGDVTAVDTINTSSFLEFINFTGNLFPGMNIGYNEEAYELLDSDFVSIEIRFGPGISQKAHRFFVPFEATSGVQSGEYTYQDYIDVPFQVWDVKNSRQLMCSFRDQERDGEFNLYERTDLEGEYGLLGREYLFINGVEYDPVNPDPNIAVTGGRSYKLLYFFWPSLATGGSWDPNNIPTSQINIEFSNFDQVIGEVSNASDAYGQFSGNNTYNQSQGVNNTSIPGFHPDHHALEIVPIDESTGEFWVLNGNDGGLGVSKNQGETFEQIKNNYITTQFYGVSKKPKANEYFGGMQDNGSWQSPSNQDATIETQYFFRLGGDGFETVWHKEKPSYLLGTQYYNAIYLSKTGGTSWEKVTAGINGDGPFITKLTNVPSTPDKVLAVGSEGVFSNSRFGVGFWNSIKINDNWAPDDVTSSHNVKVSIANDSIVWAGAGLTSEYGYGIYVSLNQGGSFTQVAEPVRTIDALISGIATHPTEDSTAYLLYSVYGEAKILRTMDLGQTWEDITGFDESGKSTNGFPDVACLSLFVFPDTPNRIWAGTEIGIMESLDNGKTWQYLNSKLEAVPIWQIFYQDGQIVVATYGRGIWTYQYEEVTNSTKQYNVVDQGDISIYPVPVKDYLNFEINSNATIETLEVDIFDMNGKHIATNLYEGENSGVIDVSLLKPGLYIARFSGNNKVIIKRFSKLQ